MKRALLLLALCGCGCGCGSPPPAAYTREADVAHARLREGRHREAAEAYERAAQRADERRDADEARYRAADAYARAGDVARAEALYRALAAAPGERQSRADFALAELFEQSGQLEAAQAQLALAIRRHPNSGVARGALGRHLDYRRERGGSALVLKYLAELSPALATTELGETLAYRRARELETSGDLAAARDAYLECAARYPYPTGAFWDDALLRAARVELSLGAPERAIAHLRRMLGEQERARIMGSYERPRYAEAQLELGRLYRDVQHDPAGARAELRRVWLRHPKSTLVDDALFEEALVAKSTGDARGTCEALTILVRERPASRYAACAHLLCSTLSPSTSPCRDYVKREAGLP